MTPFTGARNGRGGTGQGTAEAPPSNQSNCRSVQVPLWVVYANLGNEDGARAARSEQCQYLLDLFRVELAEDIAMAQELLWREVLHVA